MISLQKTKYRLNYWLRKFALAIGICPKCRSRLNYTPTGRPICPFCGK